MGMLCTCIGFYVGSTSTYTIGNTYCVYNAGPSVPEGATVIASGPTAEATTTPALEAAKPATDNDDGDDILPIIVGVVVGVIALAVFVVIVVVAAIVYRRRKGSKYT